MSRSVFAGLFGPPAPKRRSSSTRSSPELVFTVRQRGDGFWVLAHTAGFKPQHAPPFALGGPGVVGKLHVQRPVHYEGLQEPGQSGRVAHVLWVEVLPEFQRSRVATKLYEVAFAQACRVYPGSLFASDDTRSFSAQAFWEKQVERKRAYFWGGFYVLKASCSAPLTLSGAR
jgi:hypothetical protein